MNPPLFQKIRRIHFVGVGGAGMCGIAEVLLTMGFQVSGSDQKESPVLERLRSLKGSIFVGHRAEQIGGAQVVVVSNAVAGGNVEVAEARARKIPVIPRAEMLAELMRLKIGVAIAGTHGKTTTTSMAAMVLNEAGLDPTFVIGGKLNSVGSHARLGQGPHLVVEADEAFGSFLHLNPVVAVITNVDNDHLDFYKDMETLKKAFLTFIHKMPFYGCAVVCSDDPGAASLLPEITRRTVTYGTYGSPDLLALGIQGGGGGASFDVQAWGKKLGRVALKVPGEHNIKNALAALGVGLELEIPFETIARGLAAFTGVERRFEPKGEAGGVLVYDDYAHHPTEVAATLKAARSAARGKLTVVFQPHLFSRTQLLHESFAWALKEADRVVLTDIYPAREAPIPGVTAQLIAEDLKKLGHRDTHFIAQKEDVPAFLRGAAAAGDLVVTMGAGNIWQTGEQILKALQEKKT